MALDPGIVDSVSNANLKNLADSPAFYTGLAMGNAVSHQKALDVIRESAIGSVLKNFSELDPAQALSLVKANSGQDVAGMLGALGNVVAALQQSMKGAQTTPPPTAG